MTLLVADPAPDADPAPGFGSEPLGAEELVNRGTRRTRRGTLSGSLQDQIGDIRRYEPCQALDSGHDDGCWADDAGGFLDGADDAFGSVYEPPW